MSSPEVHQLFYGQPITCHAYNKDKTLCALSPGNKEVQIWQKKGTNWVFQQTLDKHDKIVTSIDWAPNTNRIVSCSQDRNAYVWTWDAATSTWRADLVLLRFNRAATFVRWSPAENKFAVASGARLIAICYFEEDNNWWVSKHIKKPIRSTVLSLDWHPENILLVAGSTDMKARVFSAWIKGIDQKASNPVWGEKLPFGTLCGEFGTETDGWVHSVAFAPSGNAIAYASHDASLSIATGPNNPVTTIATPNLPLTSIIFASETSVIGVGHDCTPYLFALRGGRWELVDKIDAGKKKEVSGNSAFRKFQQMDSRSQSTTDVELNTTHQNTITSVRAFAGAPNNISKFSTTGVDGKLVFWDLLSSGVAGMRI
ncbi:Polycomb protein sop-2 [Borealophlyctis nickersoniae]|nr:Polycomb protein sop-2 [Borealophlyctis nickersoniae]